MVENCCEPPPCPLGKSVRPVGMKAQPTFLRYIVIHTIIPPAMSEERCRVQVFILCLPFFLGAILAKYGILAWAKSISQSHFAVFLSITVLMVMLLYKFYFPSGIIDPFISAVFVICCIILTNIVKSGGCIIYLPL